MELPLIYLIPELLMLATATLCLLLGLARSDSVRRWTQVIAVFGLLATFLVTLSTFVIRHSSFVISSAPLAQFFNPDYVTLLVAGIGLLSVLAAWNMPFKSDPSIPDSTFRGEFFALLLFSLTGVSLVAKVNDIVFLFLALELVSIPTYILVATGRSHALAQEAGVKYFFLGALAAAIYLFGFSYLYGYAGSTRFDVIAAQFTHDLSATGPGVPLFALIGLVLVLIGVSYKIAAVPLHFYTPDVYQGAATPVTAFLAFAPKAAGLVALIKILTLTGWSFTATSPAALASTTAPAVFSIQHSEFSILSTLLTTLAILTMTVGNVLGFLQRNVKRLFAYSSIAHSGYMLVGLAAGPTLDPHTNGLHAALFYLAAYSLMNLGAFAVLIHLQGKADAAEEIDDLAGLSKDHPLPALLLALCLFSLIGMPGTVGFLGKLYLLQAALGTGHRLLALALVLNAAIAAAYYLRIIAALYLRDAWTPFTLRPALMPRLAAIICTVLVVLFFLFPAPLLNALR